MSQPTPSRRRRRERVGLAPEAIAAVLVVVVYGLGLGGIGLLSATAAPDEPERTLSPSPSTGPGRSADPLSADIAVVLEIDRRLLEERTDLEALLEDEAASGADLATLLRRVNGTAALGSGRIEALARDSRTAAAAGQLELIYGEAGVITDRALDLAISNDSAYRDAAIRIVELFADLPAIDAELQAIVDALASPSASTVPSPPATASPSTATPDPITPAPTTAAPSVSPVPSPSPTPGAAATPVPGELLENAGWETGLEPWMLVVRAPDNAATAQAGEPLGPVGSASLRVDVTAIDTSPSGIRVGQGGLSLRGDTRYRARVTVASATPREVRLRVVGPTEETFAIRVATVDATGTTLDVTFTVLAPVQGATFWVDIGGPATGPVWLDDASLTPGR